MKLITKIAGGLSVILAGITALFWYGRSKKQEGKKEAYIDAKEVESKNAAIHRQKEHEANITDKEQDHKDYKEMGVYTDEDK